MKLNPQLQAFFQVLQESMKMAAFPSPSPLLLHKITKGHLGSFASTRLCSCPSPAGAAGFELSAM